MLAAHNGAGRVLCPGIDRGVKAFYSSPFNSNNRSKESRFFNFPGCTHETASGHCKRPLPAKAGRRVRARVHADGGLGLLSWQWQRSFSSGRSQRVAAPLQIFLHTQKARTSERNRAFFIFQIQWVGASTPASDQPIAPFFKQPPRQAECLPKESRRSRKKRRRSRICRERQALTGQGFVNPAGGRRPGCTRWRRPCRACRKRRMQGRWDGLPQGSGFDSRRRLRVNSSFG